MPSYFPDVDDELEELRQREQRLRASDARLGVMSDPSGRIQLPSEQDGARLYALVYDLTQWQQKYPWLKPQVKAALAKYEVDPDTPQGKAIAQMGAKVKMDSGLYFYESGKTVAAGALTPAQQGSLDTQRQQSALNAIAIAEEGLGTAYVGTQGSFRYLRDTEHNRYVRQTGHTSTAYEFTEGVDGGQPVLGKKLGGGGGGGGSGQVSRSAAGTTGGIEPIIRTGMMVLDAPLQELQGQFRNMVSGKNQLGIANQESQSDLGIALGNLSRGEEVDVGDGMFVDPESDVAKERVRRALERGNIGGRTITPGRWLADKVFEQDSKPFNLLSGTTDLAVAIGADPSNIVLAGSSKLRAANKMFTEAGGLFGLRRTVSPVAVQKWLDGEAGTKVAEWIAKHDQPLDILNGFNKKLDRETLVHLADARTADEVKDVLRPQLGTLIPEKPSVPNDVFNLRATRTKSSRLGGIMPRELVDLDDGMDAVTQVERSLRNVKAPVEMQYEFIDKMARATDRIERFAVLEEMWGGVKGMLVHQGVDPEHARSVTKMFTNSHEGMFKAFVDDVGNPVQIWEREVNSAGEFVRAADPGLLVQHVGQYSPLPDPRALRRATSRYRHILATKEDKLKWPIAAVDGFQQQVWKPAALIRGAWTLRVVGEEQLRMAATGLDSMFHHPLSAIAWVMGHKGDTDILGRSFADAAEHAKALTRGTGGWVNKLGEVRTGDYRIVEKSIETMSDYKRGLAEELAELHADPIAREIAKFDNLGDAKAWLRGEVDNGRGAKLRNMLVKAGHDELLTRGGSDRYVETLSKWINTKTGGNSDLLDVIRNGKLADVAIDLTADGQMKLNPKFLDALDGYTEHGPQAVKASSLRMTKGDAIKERYDRAVETLFGGFMSMPTNKFSRSPTFNQAYYNHMPTLLPHMTIDAQQAAIAAAKEAGISGDLLRALKNARGSVGDLSLEEADFLAKGHALDFTKNLLYDMTEKSQFFDAARMILPFGEAWREIITRWSKIAYQRPQVIRRAQQLVQGARGPGLGEMLGAPSIVDPTTGVSVQQGFFYNNTNGEEVFVYPGSEWLTSQILDVPIPLVGRAQGLNMVAQIFPALGPVAQIPAGYFMPDTPAWDAVNEIVFPFGRPDDPADARNWLPSWAQKFLDFDNVDDPDALRNRAGAIMDVARYLASTGKYDTSTPEGTSKLMDDATKKARFFVWIRGAAQFVAPSAPAPEWLTNTKTNGLIASAMLAQEYRFLQQADYENAAQTFLDKYGTDAYLVMQSKTHMVVYGYPVTDEGVDWMQEHGDVKKNLPNVFGFFAPQGGDFSYPAYLRSINDGARQPLSPDQFIQLGNARLAAIEFQAKKDELNKASGGKYTDEQRAWLRDWKETLMDEYPGYREQLNHALGLVSKADEPQLFHELELAVTDKTVLSTPAGQALKEYLDIRALAQTSAVELDLKSFTTAKSARHLRDWLREWGNTLSSETPDFLPLWEQILEGEMADDLDEVAR